MLLFVSGEVLFLFWIVLIKIILLIGLVGFVGLVGLVGLVGFVGLLIDLLCELKLLSVFFGRLFYFLRVNVGLWLGLFVVIEFLCIKVMFLF